jgi:hypothetical protein
LEVVVSLPFLSELPSGLALKRKIVGWLGREWVVVDTGRWRVLIP